MWWGRVLPGVGAVVFLHAAAAAHRGVVCLSKMAAAVWVMTQHWDPTIYSFSSLPKTSVPSFSSRVSSQLCPSFPGVYCLWPALLVVNNLVTLHSEVMLKLHKVGQKPSWGQDCCFLSSCCCWEGNGLPEQGGCCHMGDDLAPGSQHLLSQFSPQSFCSQSLLRHL